MAEIVGREVLLKDENGEVIVPYVGYASQGRNIGDIFYTSRLDTELNGAFECNGGTYNTADFSGKQSIGNLLSGGKLPYVSLAEYESVVTANGSCRAFGWDGGVEFRVPLLKDVYIEAGTASSAGEFISESLPNITGTFLGGDAEHWGQAATGAFEDTEIASVGFSGGNSKTLQGKSFSAQKSSSTYQDGAKVKPDSVRYRAMVQLAISTTDDAVITATSALQQIANKVDKNSSTDRETVVNWGMPDYSAVVSITSPFTVPKAGIVIIEHSWSRSQQMTYVNGHCFIVQNNGSSSGQQSAGAVIVNAGDEITTTATWQEAVFVPMKGVN